MDTSKPTNRQPWTAFVLGAVAVLAASLLWHGITSPRTAYAQVPDSGKQRLEMIAELKAANKKLTEIAGYLREIRDVQKGDKKPKDQKPPAQPTRPS